MCPRRPRDLSQSVAVPVDKHFPLRKKRRALTRAANDSQQSTACLVCCILFNFTFVIIYIINVDICTYIYLKMNNNNVVHISEDS